MPSLSVPVLAALLSVLTLMSLLSLCIGSQGWEPIGPGHPASGILWDIRVPRTLGVAALGALLGLCGALAQGLFRNPLADPYLLGSGSGAALAVTLLAALTAGASAAWQPLQPLMRLGVMGLSFIGALTGVVLTLLLARGAAHTHRLLLAGLVVGIVLGSLTDLVSTFVPDAWRQRQGLLLGQTNLLDRSAAWALGLTLAMALPLSMALSRALDALTLGEDSAASLGLPVARLRMALVALMAWCTAVAVSQAGLILFVALAAPHIARHLPDRLSSRGTPASGLRSHRALLPASAATAAVLLLMADLLARWLLAPQELPVGVVTGVGGGLYLLSLLGRGRVK